jgi:hypothetical protein
LILPKIVGSAAAVFQTADVDASASRIAARSVSAEMLFFYPQSFRSGCSSVFVVVLLLSLKFRILFGDSIFIHIE